MYERRNTIFSSYAVKWSSLHMLALFITYHVTTTRKRKLQQLAALGNFAL
jgi:cytochrome oxidase assembly protein ShyY1